MKILIVSVVFPYPVDAGGSAGTFKMIEYARQFHDITFISLHASADKVEALQQLWPNVDIHVATPHEVEYKPSLPRRLIQLFRKEAPVHTDVRKKNMVLHSTHMDTCYFPQIIHLTQSICKKKQFDLIQTEYIEFAPLIHFLPKETPKVHLHHELRFRRMQLEYDLQSEQQVADKWHIETTKTLEISTLKMYDKVLTVSENDARILRENGMEKDKVVSSPLPVEPAREQVNQPFNFRRKVVYLGPQRHFPNYDGVKWFIDEIWPIVRKQNPDLTFEVVGKWPEGFQEPFKQVEGLHFRGFVKDLEEVLEGAIMVVPLRIGGGMRMKLLEAISWHTPIVTTSAGAEGLPLENGVNALIADTPSEFAKALAILVKDKQLQSSLIRAAKPVLGEHFSIEKCGKKREAIYQSLLP